MENLKSKERGITLVSLVITIIVLILLAGVSLNALFGDSRIIKNAQKAKLETEISNEKELIGQANTLALAQSKTGEITVEEMQKAMNDTAGEKATTAINNGDKIAVKFEKSGRYYNVDENGNVELFTPYFDTKSGDLAQNSDGEYMIESIEDLVVFSAMTNGGYKDEEKNVNINSNNSIKAVLMCDLDFKSPLSYGDSTTTIYNGYLGVEENVPLIEALTNTKKYKGFIPIGNDSNNFNTMFSGTFDGKDHYIRNLYEDTDTYGGLFGYARFAIIKNVTVTGKVISTNYAGGIVGCLEAGIKMADSPKIINCTNYINVTSSSNVGGIIGVKKAASGSIIGCSNFGLLYSSESKAGGILGVYEGGGSKEIEYYGIRNCANYGSVYGEVAARRYNWMGRSRIFSYCIMPK